MLGGPGDTRAVSAMSPAAPLAALALYFKVEVRLRTDVARGQQTLCGFVVLRKLEFR